ncbi:MAG TPA: membrane fusion protein MtrC, partial [Myxococcales bacterium]|nr:membrane fusion protein MtrC [Myxococcales bacterium]
MRRAFTLVLALSACSASPNASPHLAPASVEHPVAESDLTVVRLTEEAVRRL